MAAPYIPPKDSDLLAFANTYATTVAVNPSIYGLVAGDSTTITNAVNTYAAAQAVVDNPATKSVTTVNAKNAAKQAMIGILRTYSAQIRLNPGVSNDAKLAIGLNLPNNTPTPVPAPVTVPILTVIGQQAGTITVRFADSTTPDKRSKPAGAVQLELWLGVETAVVTDPTLCTKVATITKQPVAITFPIGSSGKVYTFFGRWLTRRGLAGDWSSSITGTIGA
jgi:hypothetical protein